MKYKLNNQECEIIFKKLEKTDLADNKFVIVDEAVTRFYPEIINGLNNEIYILDANEENKNLENLNKILTIMYQKNITRKTLIVGIGGGVTTDMAGFATSVYKRGCRLMQVPTTLLSMVDAAIGGKTGVNFQSVKNGLGSFYPAEKIIINIDFLKTLSKTEMLAGMVEIIKMSFLPESKLALLLKNKSSHLELVQEAIRTKMEICVKDLEDRGLRRLLNLGHTFGHVLESVSKYEIKHGTAVAIGMHAAAKFSKRKKLIGQSEYNEISARFILHDLPNNFSSKYIEQIKKNGAEILQQDKKADTKINLVLFKGIQELTVYRTDNFTEIIDSLLEFANG